MYKNIRKRIFRNIGANAFSQVVGIFIQLVSVPLFLETWGVKLYGEWLILSAIPTYFSMSDLSFATVAANEMTMQVARDDRSSALEVFQSTFILISGISLTVMSLAVPIIWLSPLEKWLKITQQSHLEVVIVTVLLTLYILIGLQSGLLSAGFRCDGNYALGTLIGNIIRLGEFGIVLTLVYFGASPTIVALAFLLVRVIGYIGVWLILRRHSPWIKLGYRHAKIKVIKRLAQPAIAYMGFPISYALNNQGSITVVSTTLGSEAVVIFSILRTLSRLVLQVMNVINQAILPELSVAYGTGDLSLLKNLHRRSCQVSVWLSFVTVICLFIVGPWIILVWTHGKVVMDMTLFSIMLCAIIGNSFWSTSSCVLGATNRHQGVAVCYVTTTAISLIVAIYLTSKFGLNGTAVSVLCTEIVMSMNVVNASLSLVQDNFISFVKSVFSFPKLSLRKI